MCSDVTGFKKLGLDSQVWAWGRFGFRQLGSGFCWVFTLSYITNWGLGLVLVYVEKSGLGPIQGLKLSKSGFCRVFRNPLHHYPQINGKL